MDKQFYDNLREKVRGFKENGGCHELSHTDRVYNMANLLLKYERADRDIVKAAALLHDIARMKEERGEIECHAEEGAKMAEKILNKSDFPRKKIEGVCYAIRVHRYKNGLEAKTKEAQILQDADRLDALGAICIARIFAYGGKKDRVIYEPSIKPRKVYSDSSVETTSFNHFYEKILKIKPETFNTKTARKIAQHRYKFVEGFVKEFLEECEGRK